MSALSGINLIGPASANVGQGVVLREYARALLAQGCPIAVLDLAPAAGAAVDLSLQPYFAASAEALPTS
ncbi:MAG: hypothetical protein IPI08_13625 [Betaproteobacteria bacterium]|nr:hypothetical protein [Betaproteobacteria bacterium]